MFGRRRHRDDLPDEQTAELLRGHGVPAGAQAEKGEGVMASRYESEPERLYRVTYALAGHLTVVGVVSARSRREAVEKIEAEEVQLGRGRLVPGATDVELVDV